MGFKTGVYNQTDHFPGTDLICHKIVGGHEYNIAVEAKANINRNEAIKYGIATLKSTASRGNFNKLLLVLLNVNIFSKKNTRLNHFLKGYPTNLEIIDLHDLRKWTDSLAAELLSKTPDEVFHLIKEVSKKLIELVAKNPGNLQDMEWRDLERMMAELFEGIGFETTLTPGSKDGGKDIILECTIENIRKSFIVEIKHWRSRQKVGVGAVREFTKVIINEKREKGLFLSTYGFSGNFYEYLTEKEKAIVRFGEEEKMVELCRTYEKIKSGIWNPLDSLEKVLFDKTTGPG